MNSKKKVFGFIALAIAMFMGTLDSTIINIALPDIMNHFGSNLNDTSWISTIYVMGLSVFMITASKLADQFGRKKIMIIGLLLFGISSALCGLSGSLLFLIGMRLIQGIGGAMITPIVIPMALEIFGKENTQKIAGAVGAVTALAAAGGPPLGGLFVKYINWQMIFFVNIPFAFASVILTVIFIDESYDNTASKSIDWLGMLFLTSTLFPLTFGLLKGTDYGWNSSLIITMFIISVVSIFLFILVESKVDSPLVELDLFREHTFTTSSICYMITGFGIVSPILIFNYFLQNALGYEVLKASFIVMSVSLSVIITMPLGSILASKFGARPINFLGLLFMGIGAFLLSMLKTDTPEFTMIEDMIVCGIGLGFSCQSLVSSIKFLPSQKSGIGSGIVNSARQIGTCIGIALLVNILNINVDNAKTDILDNTTAMIKNSDIDSSIQTVLINDISKSINRDSANKEAGKELEDNLRNDIKNALANLKTASRPEDNQILMKLYDGCTALSDGISSVSDGENALNSGLSSLDSGLSTLYDGSGRLTDGITTLHKGLGKLLDSTDKVDSSSDEGLGKLTSGIGRLNGGAQQILLQFSSGKASKTTLYDGVSGVADGARNLSTALDNYTSAVNTTIYMMIAGNPQSPQLLDSYESSLKKLKAAYLSAGKADKRKYLQQIKSTQNLVNLYTVGTAPDVKNVREFEKKLARLAQQDANNLTVISTGSNLNQGSDKLSVASRKIREQFENNGSFKKGIKQLAGGISRLNNNSQKLSALQGGISRLNSAISKLEAGSEDLLAGSEKLLDGMISAKTGSSKLLSVSDKLIDADNKISDGISEVASGIGIADQASQIEDIIDSIKSVKDEHIEKAFGNTFLLAAVILMITSVCGLFTDRKIK